MSACEGMLTHNHKCIFGWNSSLKIVSWYSSIDISLGCSDGESIVYPINLVVVSSGPDAEGWGGSNVGGINQTIKYYWELDGISDRNLWERDDGWVYNLIGGDGYGWVMAGDEGQFA